MWQSIKTSHYFTNQPLIYISSYLEIKFSLKGASERGVLTVGALDAK